jgi:hypothetical protein
VSDFDIARMNSGYETVATNFQSWNQMTVLKDRTIADFAEFFDH